MPFLFVLLSGMSIKVDISFNGILSSFGENKRKKIDRLQKSVNSTNKDYADFSYEKYVNNQDLSFSNEEIQSALKRLEKNENEFRRLFADIDFDKLVENRSIYSKRYANYDDSFVVSLFKAIFGFVIPGVYCDDYYSYFETEAGWTKIHISEDLKAAVLAELYYRRTIRILSNILSKFFEFRNLITAESPIKRITYKYFDLISSLKKEGAFNAILITQFVKQLFNLRNNEEIYIRNIQVAGRT